MHVYIGIVLIGFPRRLFAKTPRDIKEYTKVSFRSTLIRVPNTSANRTSSYSLRSSSMQSS